MANDAIRAAAKEAGVKLWQVAEYCGVSDSTFSRKLRRELPIEQTERILNAIESMRRRREEQERNYLEIRNEAPEVS